MGEGHVDYLRGLAHKQADTGSSDVLAFECFVSAARRGHVLARHEIASAFFTGRGVEKNISEAVAWNLKGASDGHAISQYHLARNFMYEDATGKADLVAAELWCHKAALQEYAAAEGLLGCLHLRKKEYAQAISWLQKAAAHKDSDALYRLAGCYKTGTGVAKDDTQAFTYWLQAAHLHHIPSQRRVMSCYKDGRGVAVNTKWALRWLYEAAKLGDPQSEYEIGCWHRDGNIACKSIKVAKQWLLLAAAHGHVEAKQALATWPFSTHSSEEELKEEHKASRVSKTKKLFAAVTMTPALPAPSAASIFRTEKKKDRPKKSQSNGKTTRPKMIKAVQQQNRQEHDEEEAEAEEADEEMESRREKAADLWLQTGPVMAKLEAKVMEIDERRRDEGWQIAGSRRVRKQPSPPPPVVSVSSSIPSTRRPPPLLRLSVATPVAPPIPSSLSASSLPFLPSSSTPPLSSPTSPCAPWPSSYSQSSSAPVREYPFLFYSRHHPLSLSSVFADLE